MQFHFMKNLIIVIVGALIVVFVLSKVSSKPSPVVENPTPVEQVPTEIALTSQKGVVIYVTMPDPNVPSGSPLKITGRAPGNWFFEASAPVTLTNWDGLIIGEKYIQAQGEWMTTDYVPFEGEITFTEGNLYNRGFLIFKKDNPSGLPEHDDSAEMMIKIN
jgi:hypothetical protein